tara:strand:- start:308 stop:490 length:183 start_codon:yes stop_codon:yes gene_type:complete
LLLKVEQRDGVFFGRFWKLRTVRASLIENGFISIVEDVWIGFASTRPNLIHRTHSFRIDV